MNDLKTPTRKASTPIVVRVNPEEKRAIDELARSTGHSTSAYLRKIGLGYPVKSILDYSRVQDLAQVNADLGRLGGLLKLWLSSDKRLDGYSKEDLNRLISLLLKKIDGNQDEIQKIMKAIVYS
jgi:hypothetical protein